MKIDPPLPPDAIMREMARFALETATESLARMALEYAALIRAGKFGTLLSPADAHEALCRRHPVHKPRDVRPAEPQRLKAL